MVLVISAAHSGYTPAALATSHMAASSSAGAEIESLAAAPGHAMAIALAWSRAVCSSLLGPCRGQAQI